MIDCENLTIGYGETVAVNGMNLHIHEGEKVSVVGASGCGKTSLLHGLAGIIAPLSGHIAIHRRPVSGIREGTAIILQKDGLFPWKTVYGNVVVGLSQGRVSDDEEALVMATLDELGLKALSDRYLHQLSGGQRQRVAIARALVQRPDLLLMDEPTGALDMMSKEQFQDRMHRLYERHAMTSVIVTHDIEEAVYLGQRIVVMAEGRIKAIIQNEHWGKEGLREDMAFYEKCLGVRQVMQS